MYAWEQFHKATLALVQPGSIKDRLVLAYNDLRDIRVGDLPEEIHREFRSMEKELTRVPPFGEENAVCSTVRKMSNEEASSWATKIVTMYDSVSRSFNRSYNRTNGSHKNGHHKNGNGSAIQIAAQA